jgi:hypothetical protein
MGQVEHKEVVINREIEQVMETFRSAIECVPRGICLPDSAHIIVSKYEISFITPGGEVKLMRGDKSTFVEVRAGDVRLINDSWDMFVLRSGNKVINSPRLAVGNMVFTTDEFVEYIRRGFQVILSAANWV